MHIIYFILIYLSNELSSHLTMSQQQTDVARRAPVIELSAPTASALMSLRRTTCYITRSPSVTALPRRRKRTTAS